MKDIIDNCSTYPIDFDASPQYTFNNVLDLVDAFTTGTNPTDLNSTQTTLNDPIFHSPIQNLNMGSYD